MVLAVEAAGRRLLLTGDLEGPALAAFVAAEPGACDVLVAPHHGTRTSLPADIARATSPGLVLVSGVGGPSWPEVSAAYRDAAGAATVLKTGGEGAIAVALTAAQVDVSRYSAGRWRKLPALERGSPPIESALLQHRSPTVVPRPLERRSLTVEIRPAVPRPAFASPEACASAFASVSNQRGESPRQDGIASCNRTKLLPGNGRWRASGGE